MEKNLVHAINLIFSHTQKLFVIKYEMINDRIHVQFWKLLFEKYLREGEINQIFFSNNN